MNLGLMTCQVCGSEAPRTGRRQLRCKSCSYVKACADIYAARVASGSIKKPGVGTGNGQGSGPEHHSWKDGSSVYRKLRGTKCERCGSTKFLCAHHKDEDRTNNAPENIETLCKSCHQIEHKAGLNFGPVTADKAKLLSKTIRDTMKRYKRDARGRMTKERI